jgi:hypothetical protein
MCAASRIDGRGLKFFSQSCGLLGSHQLYLEDKDREALVTLDKGSCATATRVWNLTQDRLHNVCFTFEQSVCRLQPAMVTFLVDFAEERLKASLGLSHETLAAVFPDGTIGGVPYVAVGYDYEKATDQKFPSWANQCNAALAFSRILEADRLCMLSLETSILTFPADLRCLPNEIVTCRLNSADLYSDQIFKDFDSRGSALLEETLENVVLWIEDVMLGEVGDFDVYFLPMIAMLQRNTCGIFKTETLWRTQGWDPKCDARGGMEDVKRWLCSLLLAEVQEPGSCRKMLLSGKKHWVFYKDVRDGVSLLPDDDKWTREKKALADVFDDIQDITNEFVDDARVRNECVVPSERSMFLQ